MEGDGEWIALTWYLHNACDSNVELAIISRVRRRWRDVASAIVAKMAIDMAGWGEDDDVDDDDNDDGKGFDKMTSSFTSSCFVGESSPFHPRRRRYSCIRTLLITDMARELVEGRRSRTRNPRRRHHERHLTTEDDAGVVVGGCDGGPTTHPTPRPGGGGSSNTDGHFCLAWFAPSGMRTASVPLDDDDDDDSKDERRRRRRRRSGDDNGRGRTSRRGGGKRVNCCTEWRGYRQATEVLIPFGYTEGFVLVSAITDVCFFTSTMMVLIHSSYASTCYII